jgi:hypothetical protein
VHCDLSLANHDLHVSALLFVTHKLMHAFPPITQINEKFDLSALTEQISPDMNDAHVQPCQACHGIMDGICS